MKLREVKSLILQNGLTEDLLEAFLGCMKRVRTNYDRCQHCYTFGAELVDKDLAGGIRLIQMGLEQYAETDHDRYRSYYNLGLLQEAAKNYTTAKESYLLAFSFSKENTNVYLDLLRNELHLTGFGFSEDLVHFAAETSNMAPFARQMPHAEFYLLLGQAVLQQSQQDKDGLSRTKIALGRLLYGNEPTWAARLLRRKHINSGINATEQALVFVKTLHI